jgi:hypothetical protein
MLRVCRPGGTIALATWTPSGLVGQMFRIIASHVPPPTGVPSPIRWGDETKVRERLGAGTSGLRMTPRLIAFEFPFSPVEVVQYWRLYYGPTSRAFEALTTDPVKQGKLRADLERLWTENNKGAGKSTRVEAEYLEVRATRGRA